MINNDPMSWIGEGVAAGEFVPDPVRPRSEIYVPGGEEELAAMTSWLVESINEAEELDARRQQRIIENRKIYAAEPEKGQILQIPIAKQDANQTTAGLVNAVLGKSPVITVRPNEAGSIELVQNTMIGGEKPVQVTTVEYAKALQQYITYLISRRIPFRKVFTSAVRDMVMGGMPFVKVVYELNSRVIREKEFKSGDVEGSMSVQLVERETELDEPLKFLLVDGLNILMPPGQTDHQLSEWFAEKVEWSPSDIRKAFASGKFYSDPLDPEADPDEEKIASLIKSSAPSKYESIKRRAARLLHRELPRRMNPLIHEVWFYWTIPAEMGKYAQRQYQTLHLCAQVHVDTRQILSIYRAHYDHGLRPYVPFLQRPDSYEWASGSTVEDLGTIQKLMSTLFHITLKNGIQAITKAYKVKIGSPAWKSMMDIEKQGGIKPGSVVGVGNPDEVTEFQTGGTLGSMASEIGFLDQQRRELSVIPEHKDIPNRTAAGTVSQIMQEGKAQGAETLNNAREAVAQLILMAVQTAQQFSEYGETVPFENPKTKQIAENILYFPSKLLSDQFVMEVTATADDQTVDARKEAEMMNLRLVNEQSEISAAKVMEMLNAETPPFIAEVHKQTVLRGEKKLNDLLALTSKDSELFTWDEEELEAMLQAKREYEEEQARIAAEEAERAAQEGAMNAGTAAPGGPVPPEGAPQLGGPPPVPAGPGMAGPPTMPPPEVLLAMSGQSPTG